MRFTHVVNPFPTAPGSEHHLAWRITHASMRRAMTEANSNGIEVEALGAVRPGEEHTTAEPVRPVAAMTRTVQDVATLKPVRPMPLIADILQTALDHGTGEYVVFTNIDIALKPGFYIEVDAMIREANRPYACAINRRTISDEYTGPEQLEQMYAEPGEPHPGWDCFILPRELIGSLRLGHTCISARHFDALLVANLDTLTGYRFVVHRDKYLTFHLGDDRTWVWRIDYEEHNLREALSAMEELAHSSDVAPPAGSHFDTIARNFARHAGTRARFIRLIKRQPLAVQLIRFAREELLGRRTA